MSTAFRYRALDPSGQEVIGELQCTGRPSVLDALQRRGLTPIEITAAAKSDAAESAPRRSLRARAAWLRWDRTQVAPREWLSLTQSLTALLSAGLPVDRALQIAGPLAPGPATRSVVERLLE